MAVGIRLQWYGGRYKNLHKHDREFRREVLSGERGLNVGNILFLDATFLDENGAPFYHEPEDPSRIHWEGYYDGALDFACDGNGSGVTSSSQSHWALTERGDAKADETHGMTTKMALVRGTDGTRPGSLRITAPHPHSGAEVSAEIKFPKLD